MWDPYPAVFSSLKVFQHEVQAPLKKLFGFWDSCRLGFLGP